MQAKTNHNLKSVPDLLHGIDMIELLETLNDTLTFLSFHKENLASVLVQYFYKTKRLAQKMRIHSHQKTKKDDVCVSLSFTISSILALNGNITQAFKLMRRNSAHPKMQELQGYLWSTVGQILGQNSAANLPMKEK